MSTKKKSKGPGAPPRPSWIPNWTDSDAYAIPSHKLPFSLHIIAFDFLRRNPDYIRDYTAFKTLTVSKQTEDAPALCDKYAIANGWPPDPAIDPRSDTQLLPIYQHSFFPHLHLPIASGLAQIRVTPGVMIMVFSNDLPLEKQLKAASSLLRERRSEAPRQKMHRNVDRLLIDLRLLDANLDAAKWEDILKLFPKSRDPKSLDLSTAHKAYDRAVEIRDGLYQFLPEPKGSWGI
jgi:hypothetical protein